VLLSLGIWLGWSFYLWRKMRADFGSREVLKLSLGVVIAELAIGWAVKSTWGAIIGAVGLMVWWSAKSKWNVWEIMDEVIPAGYVSLWGWMMIWKPGINWLFEGIIVLLGLIIGWKIKQDYKGYRWYKSGKTGFVGLYYIGWWALREIGSGFVYSPTAYLLGIPVEELAGVWMLTAVLVAVYLRSESNTFSNLRLWKRKP